MTQNQEKWAKARSRLAAAVTSLGYPDEFAECIGETELSRGVIISQQKRKQSINRRRFSIHLDDEIDRNSVKFKFFINNTVKINSILYFFAI